MRSQALLGLFGLLLSMPTALKPVGLVTLVSGVATALVAVPSMIRSWHVTAKDVVEWQEDVRSYYLTVKIKRHVKTIKEHTFTAFDHESVIKKALAYVKKKQTAGLRSVFKPTIRVLKDWQLYPLHAVVTKALPKKSALRAAYWEKLEEQLVNRYKVPSRPTSRRISLEYLSWAMGAGILFFLLGLLSLYFSFRKKLKPKNIA